MKIYISEKHKNLIQIYIPRNKRRLQILFCALIYIYFTLDQDQWTRNTALFLQIKIFFFFFFFFLI